MPWDVKKVKNQFCVVDKDGKQKKCYSDKAKADAYKKALYANAGEKLEQATASMLEDGGPVVVGVAITNIPHLPLPQISIVEKDGQEYVRVPFLRKGIFEYKDEHLVFDDNVFSKMLSNHEGEVSHWGVMLNERHQPNDALAWFDKAGGGWITKETDDKFGDLLVGYGKPTDEKILDLVRKQKYRYASVEFKKKYKSPMVAKLSTDDLTEIQTEDLVDITKLEEIMEDVTISQEEYNALKEKSAKATEVEKLEADLTAAQTKITELEAKMKPVKPEFELPEEVKLEMEQNRKEIARLKKDSLARQIDLIIAKAELYRDPNGMAHSPVLLEAARNAMLGNEVKVKDNEVIKLESSNPADVAAYFRGIFEYLLENAPGTVKMSGTTDGEDKRSVSLESNSEYTKDEFKSWWAESV